MERGGVAGRGRGHRRRAAVPSDQKRGEVPAQRGRELGRMGGVGGGAGEPLGRVRAATRPRAGHAGAWWGRESGGVSARKWNISRRAESTTWRSPAYVSTPGGR